MAKDEEVGLLEIDKEALKEVARYFEFSIEVTPFIISDQASDRIKEAGIAVTFVGRQVEIPIDEFSLSRIPEELYALEIGGVLDPLGQLIQWLWGMIEGALTTLRQALEGFIRTVIDGLKSWFKEVYGTIEDIIGRIADAIRGVIEGLHDWFVETIVRPLESSVEAVRDFIVERVGDLIDALSKALTDFITLTRDWLWDRISSAFEALKGALTAIRDFIIERVKSFIDGLTTFLAEIRDWLWDKISEAFDTLNKALIGVRDFLIERFREIIATIRKWWDDFLTSFREWFERAWAGVYRFFKDAYDGLAKGLNLVTTTLGGFVNAVLRVHEWLVHVPEMLVGFLGRITEWLHGLVMATWTWLRKEFIPTLLDFLRTLWNLFIGFIKGIVHAVVTTFTDIAKAALNVIKPALSGLMVFATQFMGVALPAAIPASPSRSQLWFAIFVPIIWATITSGLTEIQKIFDRLVNFAAVPGIPSFIGGTSLFFTTLIGGQLLSRSMWLLFHWLGDILERFGFDTGLDIGIPTAKGLKRIRLTFNLGMLFRTIASEFKEFPEIVATGLIYGMAIWISRPISMLVNAALRDIVPIEVPPVAAMVEESRRMMALGAQPYPSQEYIAFLSRQLAFRGFPGKFAEWYVRKYDVDKVTITDRFGLDRILPTGLMYDIPTASELARMMVRDIFGPPPPPPGAPLGSFFRAMEMRGFHPDTAIFYYLLHFRYPGMERLYQFLCRVAAGLAWAEIVPTPESITYKGIDLRVGHNGHSPRAMSEPFYPAPLDASLGELRRLINIAKYYAKWMDYAPFAWVTDFTSDSAIMFDTMADIPMRIDARWMYKWMIIKDLELAKIILARGMHPDWVARMTIAEAMNALAEERTYVRGGLEALYRDGFMTKNALLTKLAHLTDVIILDAPRPVKFLPGEVELIRIRAEADRMRDVLTAVFREVTRAYYENIYTTNQAIRYIEQQATIFQFPFRIDYDHLRKFIGAYKIRWEYERVSRLRFWAWAIIPQVYRLAEAGLDPKKAIDEYAKKAKITPYEKEYLYYLIDLFLDVWKRDKKVDAVLRRVSRGVITTEEATRELMGLGIPEDIAEALVEAQVRIYAVTIAAILGYADIYDVPEEFLDKKLELLGVPDEDKVVIKEVFRLRPTRTERGQLARRILDQLSEGYITEDEARAELDKIVTVKITIDILIDSAKRELDIRIKAEKLRAIEGKLRAGAITSEEASREISQIIRVPDLVAALVDRYSKIYTLSIATLLSYATIVHIPEALIDKKLDMLGVPTDEVMIIKEVFHIRPIRDELARYIRQVLDEFEDGYIDETTARINLATAFKKPVEIDLLIKTSKLERDARIKRLKIDTILRKLRKAEISANEARRQLSALIPIPEVVNALIDRELTRVIEEYTLSITTLLSYAAIIEIPEEVIKAKLDKLMVPEPDRSIILQVFGIRPIRDELARVARSILDSYEDAYITRQQAKVELEAVFKRPREIDLLLKAADIEKRDKKAREKVRVIIDKLRQGRITIDQARSQLRLVIVDPELVEYTIERHKPVSFTSPSKIISMMERIPIPDDWLKKALEREGYPVDEIQLWKSDALVAEIEEEIKRIQRVLHRACVKEKITVNEYRNALRQLAAFWGEAHARFGVPWIVFSPLEQQILVRLAQRELELKRRTGVETIAS